MSYYQKVLMPDEAVRAMGRLHWAIYLRAWLLFAIGAVAGLEFLYLRYSDATTSYGVTPAYIAAGVAALFLLLAFIAWQNALIRRQTTEIVVTDRRIIFKEGFIRRRTMEMNLSKVETVDVIQGIWGRIFDYGSIIIRGVGSSYEPLRMIANPLALRTAIIAQ
jgi:uncharacterized membrane protein YdbT with pleckstrin-like domain